MHLGVCTSIANAAKANVDGFDFVEENVQNFIAATTPDAQWDGARQARDAALPLLAANVLVPPTLKITGPTADLNALRQYMTVVIRRARLSGMQTLVFGSGGARNVPDGFDRKAARRQILDFARMSAQIAIDHEITIVCEHLNRKECNIINSLDEAMTYVSEVDHPNFQCLVDSYHFWEENEPLESLTAALPWIKHVHVADKTSRLPSGEDKASGSDYVSFFRVLKDAGYDGPISIEAPRYDQMPDAGPRASAFLREQWRRA